MDVISGTPILETRKCNHCLSFVEIIIGGEMHGFMRGGCVHYYQGLADHLRRPDEKPVASLVGV
jgi:hypothetical protein